MQILKSRVQGEVDKGGKSKEIAERLGINLKQLQGAAEAFGINLRKKPTSLVEFVDDTKLQPEIQENEKLKVDPAIAHIFPEGEIELLEENELIVEDSKVDQAKQVIEEAEDKVEMKPKSIEDDKW